MKVANRRCKDQVNNLEEFKGSNLSGVNHGSLYVVYSYGWYPLFVYNRVQDLWLENSEKYSVSTSRQQSQARPNSKTISASQDVLRDMIHNCQYQRDGQVA